MELKTTTVLVTGFGPFGVHRVNASWEAVKELANIGFDKNIKLVTKEVPVQYSIVNKLVPKLWQDFQPKLCIHVGLSAQTKEIMLEECASNTGYTRADIVDKLPQMKCCVANGCEHLHTNINIEKICNEASRSTDCPCEVKSSCDAGRFLCEFIYYVSLNESLKAEQKGTSVLFIHIPDLDDPYTKTQLAESLKYIILEILKESKY